MAIPEFISVLRKIRDVIYPEINELYDNSLILKESIDVGKAEFDADLIQFNTDYSDFNIKKTQVDASVVSANNSALSASQSAQTATNKSNEIKAITAQSTTGTPGTQASASYNPTDGKFTFNIPQGTKGDKGESFTVNSSGITASRTLYDAQPTGWSFLDITTSTLYFKASNTSGDWSGGVPFGKGDTGDTGEQGVGITSFTFVSTTDVSGLPAKSGATDTYRVTLTNANTFDYQVYNGLDASLEYVDTQVGNVQTNLNTTNTLINSHISLNASYHLLGGNLSVDATVLTNGFGLYLYTGNTATPPTINLGMDITSQWGNTADETYGYLIKIKSRSATGDWTWVNSVRGITKYISSNTTAVEGTDANMFTLSTVAGVTTLNIGTSTRTNTNGVTYVVEVYQTTHRKTGVTNQGKSFTEHYNPDTGFTINGYQGSGLAGHEIPHSLDGNLGFWLNKNLTTITAWNAQYRENYNLNMDTTAEGISPIVGTNNNESSLTIGTGALVNTSTNQYVMFGWRNSYLDESNKLIGNYEVGVYQGTANVTGLNKVTTRGKPVWIMFKRLDSTGLWHIVDNTRNVSDPRNSQLYLNLSNEEYTGIAYNMKFNTDGFTLDGTDVDMNASGGQYLYMIVYDNDSGSGKSKYPKATDTSNVQINNGIIPLAHGIDSNGSKNSIVVANETITGLTYTEGKNYLYKTDTGYGVKAYEPRYLASELIRRFAGEQPDYYDVESNKWFNCDAGAELVTNGDGTSTVGWTNGTGATLSIENGRLKLVTTSNTTAYQSLSLIAGKTYVIKGQVQGTGTVSAQVMINNETTISNNGTFVYGDVNSSSFNSTFVATENTIKIHLRVTGAGTGYFDNISVFQIDIIPTTEISESRNYMNHIVHADADGGVLYVEELPKIEYSDSLSVDKLNVISEFDLGQTWQNVTASRIVGITYTNSTGKPIMVSLSGTPSTTNGYLTLTLNSLAIVGFVKHYNSGTQSMWSHIIVPNGYTYVVTVVTCALTSWYELR